MFFKIGAPKNFINFTGKHLCCSLFLIKLRALPATLLKKDSNKGAFLSNLRNSREHIFLHKTPRVAASVTTRGPLYSSEVECTELDDLFLDIYGRQMQAKVEAAESSEASIMKLCKERQEVNRRLSME